MAFPVNPQPGDDYTAGSKTWIWDGNKWVLLSIKNVSISKIGELRDVVDDNIPDKKDQLLAWDPNTVDDDGVAGSWVRSDLSNVEVLDDLLDVEIDESRHKLGESFGYYINKTPDGEFADPNADEDAWGRYRIDLEQNSLEVNVRDLDGKHVADLLTADVSNTIGHRIAFVDGSYEATLTLSKNIEFKGYSYVFYYREADVILNLYNEGNSKLFTIQSNEFRGLAHNTVLTYKVDPETNDAKWRPAFVAADGGANVTIGLNPPPEPEFDDIWIDASNYYMYTWTQIGSRDQNKGTWVALTGPGGVDGGSDIVNDSTVTILPSRGFSVQSGGSFTLNQPNNHIIRMSPSSTVELDGAPPAADERLKSDIWVDTKDYKMYIWNDTEWVALTGDLTNSGAIGAGFNYIPCEMDGGSASTDFCVDCDWGIDGGRAQQIFCETDDIYSEFRPGAISSNEPPSHPKKGDLWYDTESLELKVYYITESSQGRWVSTINPNAKPELPVDPNPDPVRITGPNSAVAGIASDTFTAVIGHNLLSPFFSWASTDGDAYIQKVGGSLNTVDMVFSTPGTHRVSCTVTAANLAEPVSDSLKVVVSETPDNVPIVYDVLVRFFSGGENEKSSNRFVLNGKRQPYLTFVRGKRYIFTQSDSSNSKYPLRLYGDPNKEYEYTGGVLIGKNYLEIQVPADGPSVLYYDCPDTDNTMGDIIYLAGVYQDLEGIEDQFLPLETIRRFNYTLPVGNDIPNDIPAATGDLFAHNKVSWSAPVTVKDYREWKFFFIYKPNLDLDNEPIEWDKILRSVERDGGGSTAYTTLTVKDASGTTNIYRLLKVVDLTNDYIRAKVEWVNEADVTINNITELAEENRNYQLTIHTPPPLPGDNVISA